MFVIAIKFTYIRGNGKFRVSLGIFGLFETTSNILVIFGENEQIRFQELDINVARFTF